MPTMDNLSYRSAAPFQHFGRVQNRTPPVPLAYPKQRWHNEAEGPEDLRTYLARSGLGQYDYSTTFLQGPSRLPNEHDIQTTAATKDGVNKKDGHGKHCRMGIPPEFKLSHGVVVWWGLMLKGMQIKTRLLMACQAAMGCQTRPLLGISCHLQCHLAMLATSLANQQNHPCKTATTILGSALLPPPSHLRTLPNSVACMEL
jgi:hypothetical protein